MIELSTQPRSAKKVKSIEDVENSLRIPTEKLLGAPLAIIACHFNWGGHARPIQNLKRFIREMEVTHGLPVFGIEAVMTDETPCLDEFERWHVIKVDEKARLWQKEALLNEVAKMVPHSFKHLAALDADIWFSNHDWASKARDILEEGHPVVQPFSEAVWTDQFGGAELIRESAAKKGLDKSWCGHPGFAWAFHRDFFEKVGFYQWAALGTGDIVTAAGLLDGVLKSSCNSAIGKSNFESGLFHEWRKRARDYINGEEPGYVKGSVWHEWHGSMTDRNYSVRTRIMNSCDVLRDLIKSPKGHLEWTDAADDEMKKAVADYFSNRKEDG